MGLCPSSFTLDEGGKYTSSPLQKKIRATWDYFWNEHVPEVTGGKPFVLVHNGDAIDGSHHNSTTQFSQNIKDQRRAAEIVLRPVVERAAAYYHIRGTEAHVGRSQEFEEELAHDLGAVVDEQGRACRDELWIEMHGFLGHFAHHVGTTSRVGYETTAVQAEFAEAMVHAAQWREDPPDFIVRSHRHRYIEIRNPSARGYSLCLVTPCWQGKTPFAYKIAGARQATPQFGGVVICVRHGELYTRPFIQTPGRSRRVKV